MSGPLRQVPLPASALHRVDSATALGFVDAQLGVAAEWKSLLISLRLSSEWQAGWKEEVGHWFKTAERLGFLDELVGRVLKQAKRGTRSKDIDPNDERHNDLVQELAPAMVAHYLDGTGWSDGRWEPVKGGPEDVDLGFRTPDGRHAFLQVKAPDQPGRVVGRRIVKTPAEGDERDASGKMRPEVKTGGEADWKVLKVVAKAAEQLPKAGSEVKLIAVCPNRSSLSMPDVQACLLSDLLGETVMDVTNKAVTLPRANLSKFWAPEWKHVSGVVLLYFVRPFGGEPRYSCVVLLNPVADMQASQAWFPHAHVCLLDGSTFRWVRGEPEGPRWLPDGTVIVP